MKAFIRALLLFSIGRSLTCSGNQYWLAAHKLCGASWANEESYKIYANGSLVITSQAFENLEDRTDEFCVSKTNNGQYTIELIDSYGDYWYTLAFMDVRGINGNIVFKQTLHNTLKDTYGLSLYSPINKDDTEVSYTATAVTGLGWTELSFQPGTDWTTITMGATSTTAAGTQFFRIPFTGVLDLSAYEVAFYYRYGVTAYLNGVEIFRDNMPTGTPSYDTLANGGYTALDYRGVVRNGADISVQSCVIAASVHFQSLTTTNLVSFNMYLSQYAKSVITWKDVAAPNCWMIPEIPAYTAPVGSYQPSLIYNMGRTDYYYLAVSSGIDIVMAYSGMNLAYALNGYEMYQYSQPTYGMKDFVIFGSQTIGTSVSYTQLLSSTGNVYISDTWKTVKIDFAAGYYRQGKLTIQSTASNYIYLYEFHMCVCNAPMPTSFSYATQNLYAQLDAITVVPSVTGVSSCTATGLPTGLSLDYNSCVISGKVMEAGSGAYQVTATYPMTLQGTISINAIICTGNKLHLERQYSASTPVNELYTVYNADTGAVIYDEPANSGQVISMLRMTDICAMADRIKIVTSATSLTYWYTTSMLTVYALLDIDQNEMIARTRYDLTLGIDPVTYVMIKQHIPAFSTWKYSFASSTPSATWFNDVSTWTNENTRDNFGNASNQYQLYGKTFSVSETELANSSGFTLNIRYQYGIIVYLNGNEAFRNFVSESATGLNVITASSGSYSTAIYHTIGLPTKFMSDGTSGSDAQLIQVGTNTIAIGLVASSSSITTSVFDAVVRLTGATSSDRVLDFATAYSYMSGSTGYLNNKYYGYHMYYTTCGYSNYYQITFNNDRREWVSALTITNYYTSTDYTVESPRAFKLQAKNSADAAWVTLYEAKGDWQWWGMPLTKKALFYNRKAYNMYRLYEVTTGSTSNCTWRINEMGLLSEKVDGTIPVLSYPKPVELVYRFIEIADIYPTDATGYSNFYTEPALPNGVKIDPPSGVICGTPSVVTASRDYTIKAMKVDGTEASCVLNLGVTICHGDQSLVTFVIKADSAPTTQGWTLYSGKTVTETAKIDEKYGFPAASAMYYVDNCRPHGFYTVRFYKQATSGWAYPSCFTVAVDQSGMRIDLGWVTTGTTTPTVTDVTYHSNLPWQIDFSDDWLVMHSSDPSGTNWMLPNYSPETDWVPMKMEQLTATTVHQQAVYIRHTFTITDVNEFPVLNIRARYNGGIVAFLNGRRFARFNLPEVVGSTTPANSVHNDQLFSKFHVIMVSEGGLSGENVIAFEHHRSGSSSSSTPHIFDSTAAFGVGMCNLLADSVLNIVAKDANAGDIAWAPTTGTLYDAFDRDPVSYMLYRNTIGTVMEWEIENMEKSRWNSYFIGTAYAYTGYGWSFSGRHIPADEWNAISIVTLYTTLQRSKNNFALSMGMAGFKYFRFHLDVIGSSTMYMHEFGWQYCKVSGASACPEDGDFPPVSNGELSPGDCDWGFSGYTTRTCNNGSLSSYVDTTHCTEKAPVSITYELKDFSLIRDISTVIPAPITIFHITKFECDTAFPMGLHLDSGTGQISGTPTMDHQNTKYVIKGTNSKGSITTELNISVRQGLCVATGFHPSTKAGETASYACSERGSYIGEILRKCNLGEKDGEWGVETGSCVSILLIVMLVIVAIVVVLVIIMVVVRSGTKSKVVGGVRKGSKGGSKSGPKKGSGKSIKV